MQTNTYITKLVVYKKLITFEESNTEGYQLKRNQSYQKLNFNQDNLSSLKDSTMISLLINKTSSEISKNSLQLIFKTFLLIFFM